MIPPFNTVQLHKANLLLPSAQMRIDPAENVPAYLVQRVRKEMMTAGVTVSRSPAAGEKIPKLRVWLDRECLPRQPEGYRIEISPGGITISSSTVYGLGYACSSLGVLIGKGVRGPGGIELQAMIIEDWPRYPWRGMHLDVSRNFFPVENVLRFLDLMAIHKFNRFHWHLTDDQGWRLEIPSYPQLTEVGGFRRAYDRSLSGGFYNRQDVDRVLDHAEQLGIMVIPEIEMPGHARAAIAAFPELSCKREELPVPTKWGVYEDVMCVGNESTFRIVKEVLDYVCDIFPAPYIHFGGNEVPITRWKACPRCQRRVLEEFLFGPESLQGYFMTRIADYLVGKGKRPIGWDEVLEGEPPSETVIMAWRGLDRGLAAASRGFATIMTPATHCYFDHSQDERGHRDNLSAVLPLKKVYEFDPMPGKLAKEKVKLILGGEGIVWTERMEEWGHVEYMLLPRMCALAEVLWHGRGENYDDFVARLHPHLSRLWKLGYNYRPLDPE